MKTKSMGLNTKNHWERIGKRTWKDYKWILNHCIKYYDSDEPFETLVDIGCGNGEFLETCVHFGLNAIGIEAEKDALITCKNKGLSVIALDLTSQTYPIPDNSASVVTCSQLLEHLGKEDGIHLLNEIYRILKVNGIVLIYSPSFYNISGRTMPFHLHCWKPKELEIELIKIGYKNLKFLFVPMHWAHLLKYKPDRYNRLTRKKPNWLGKFLSISISGLYFLTKAKILSGNTGYIGYKK